MNHTGKQVNIKFFLKLMVINDEYNAFGFFIIQLEKKITVTEIKKGLYLLMCCYKRAHLVLIFLVILFMVALRGHAQDLEPRAYSNAPVGLNFLLAGYSYSQGDLSLDPSIPIQDANLDVHTLILAYVHTFDLWGMSSKFNVVAPYVCVSGSAIFAGEAKERNICGFADPRFKLTVNVYGAPSLSLKEFANYKQDIIVGTSLQVTPPAGQYDSSKLINIGTNRWSFEPEIGISKAVGPITMELMGGATFYSHNNDFLEGNTLEIDPIYFVQGHVIYNFKSGIWCSLDGTYYWGGQAIINGVKGDTLEENTRVGATLSLPVNRHNSVKLYGSSGVTTRTGTDFKTLGISWQYRWGGGF